ESSLMANAASMGARLRSGYLGKVQPVGVPAAVLARAETRLALTRASA
nr:hypothetical protein [Ktedonobacterales bacterium]